MRKMLLTLAACIAAAVLVQAPAGPAFADGYPPLCTNGTHWDGVRCVL